MLRVGTSVVDITPPIGSQVAGQFHERIAELVHDPLCARAFVVDDGETRAAIVGCDLLSLKRSTVQKARALAAELTDIPATNILISATHTHTGPRTTGIFPSSADAEYVSLLPRQIASAVALAARARRPAQIGVGSGWEEGGTHNRRFLKADGTAHMHPPKGDPSFVGPEGPDDPEVGVLVAKDGEGSFLGAVVNYTSHPIVVGHERAFSADFPGYVCRMLEAIEGVPGSVTFVNGAFANVCPFDVYNVTRREYGYAWAERIGHMVGGEALRVLEKTDTLPSTPVRVANRSVELTIREIGDELVEAAHRLLATPADQLPPGVTDPRIAQRERIYADEVLRLAEERSASPIVTGEVQVIAIGPAAFVSIPAELFVEFGLEIKRRSPFLFTYIVGAANGMVGYIPTHKAFRGGGYETRLARSSKLTPEAGDIFVATAVDLLKQLHGRD
jgi:neutral ceramidase